MRFWAQSGSVRRMIAAPILHTEARIIARHAAFAGFSIPLEANDTIIPACSSPLRAAGASVAHFGLSGDATLAAVPFFHATLTSDESQHDHGA